MGTWTCTSIDEVPEIVELHQTIFEVYVLWKEPNLQQLHFLVHLAAPRVRNLRYLDFVNK